MTDIERLAPSHGSTATTRFLTGAVPTSGPAFRWWRRLLRVLDTILRPSALGIVLVLAAGALQIALLLHVNDDTALTAMAPAVTSQPTYTQDCESLICAADTPPAEVETTDLTPAARAISTLANWIESGAESDPAPASPSLDNTLT